MTEGKRRNLCSVVSKKCRTFG